MKTIVFTIDKLKRGGIQNVMIRYINGFAESTKYNVEILLKDEHEKDNEMLKEFNREIKISYLRPLNLVNTRDNHRETKKKSLISKIIMGILLPYEKYITNKNLDRFLLQNKDIAAIIDFNMSLWGYLKGRPIPKIGRVSIDPKGSFKKNPKEKTARVNSFDKIILISKDMTKDFLECYPQEKDKIFHIYNPIDLKEVEKKINEEDNLTDEEKELLKGEYIVAISMLNKRKARDELIKAYKNLVNKGIKEKLYIIGDGPEKENLKKLVKDLELEESVKFLGMKSNTFVWTKYAKIFVHPSYGEGLPNSLIEAMSTNTPIISYDCPTGPNDILEGGKCGILVKMGDITSLEENIELLLKSEELRNKYKELMKERIKDFSIENSVKRMEELVDSFEKK